MSPNSSSIYDRKSPQYPFHWEPLQFGLPDKEEEIMAQNGFRIIDSDMHVFEPHDLYLRYMNPKWEDRIPRAEPRKKHGPVKFALANGASAKGSSTQESESSPALDAVADRYQEALRCDYDAASQLRAMDVEGLDIAVLFRTSPIHTNDDFAPDYATDLCRAWNSWISDFCKENPKRLKPSALITLHDVDLAVDEARRAVNDLGAVGLALVSEPVNGRHIHDHYFDPLWRETERLGVPICFHPAANPNHEQVARRFWGHPNDGILVNAYRNPIELMLAVGSFCAGGVLERFPNLRVAFLEGNCGWLPWVLYRLDERWELRHNLATEPLSRKPSDYFLRQCFISVDVEEDLVVDVVRRIGDENIVISTDYPHADSRWPKAIETFLQIDGLSNVSRRKMFLDNCARLYNLRV